MMRKNLEITDINKIAKILEKCDVLRLGLHDNPYPYIVPLSYGFSIINDKIELYIHGAFKGKKHDLIAENRNVCIEVDYIKNYEPTKLSATVKYESIIGYGEILEIENKNDKILAMNKLIAHCGFDDLKINEQLFNKTKMYKIVLDNFTAKSNI